MCLQSGCVTRCLSAVLSRAMTGFSNMSNRPCAVQHFRSIANNDASFVAASSATHQGSFFIQRCSM